MTRLAFMGGYFSPHCGSLARRLGLSEVVAPIVMILGNKPGASATGESSHRQRSGLIGVDRHVFTFSLLRSATIRFLASTYGAGRRDVAGATQGREERSRMAGQNPA